MVIASEAGYLGGWSWGERGNGGGKGERGVVGEGLLWGLHLHLQSWILDRLRNFMDTP